jgi:hypothetical protein
MAARGALPLPPIELATVLFALTHDPDAEVKATARDSLDGLPSSVTDTVLVGETHPALLSYFADLHKHDTDVLEKIALNAATDDATLTLLAASPHGKIVDIISKNEQRIQRSPELVEALGSNPLTGRSVIERILSSLGTADIFDDLDATSDTTSISDKEAEAALRAVLGSQLGEYAEQLVSEVEEDYARRGESVESSNLYQIVQNMTVFQKIQLGRLGNKEARSLLVRDRNKLVAIGVVTSPKISESEVLSIAKSRNVCDEVLRVIAMSRQWTRSYQVKLGLASNPKCPQALAMKFVNYLQDKDLRALMRSHEISRVISTQARRILAKKGKI